MGSYNSAVTTTAGQSLIARAIAGNLPCTLTSAKTTAYVVPGSTSLASLTSLPDIKQSEAITSASVVSNTQVSASVRFNNTDITLNYMINTIGVYAKVQGDSSETLLAVITAIDPDVMPSYSAASPVAYVYDITLSISNASSVNIVVAPTGSPNYSEFNLVKDEVVAARVGSDGVQYSTLEARLNAENTDLKNAIFENEKITRFATCLDMKASTALKSGMVCQTSGYYAVNDGGAALYYIMGAAPVDDYYETLQGGLIGVLVVNDAVTPQMFGAKGDGVTDDTAAIQSALNDDSKMCVFMPGKTYKIKDFVRVTRSNKTIIMYGATIDGADEEASSAGATVSIGSPTAQEDIENIAILGGTFIGHVDLENCIGISHAANVAIKDVRTVGGSKGITAQYHCSNIIVDNCDMSNFLRCGISLESGVQNAIVRDANIHDALTTTAPTDVFSFPIGVMCDISRDEYYDAQDYKYNKNILFDNVNISNVHLGILDHADLEQNIAYKNMVISGDGSTSTYGLHAIDYRPESGLKEIDFSGKIDGFTTSFHVIGVKGLFEVDADKSCLMQYCDELEFDNCLFADQVKVQTATKSVTVNNSTFSYDSGNPVIYQQTDENLMAIFNGCKFVVLPQENVKSIVNNCTYKSMLVCSDETGEIHPITELHVEAVSVTNSDAIASGSAKEFDFDVSKTGYTPLAIVGVNKYGANAGMLAIAHSYFYTPNAHARIAFANTSGVAITPTQIFAYVLYKKAL